jgi:hypothetical protein
LSRSRKNLSRALTVAAAILAASATSVAASNAEVLGPQAVAPAGQPAPARLIGLYTARFTTTDEQTSGTWHLRIRTGHRLEVWNRLDGVANSPSFEAGPVSFRGKRMIFAKTTAEGVCTVGATYAWALHGRFLRFRLVGKDGCGPRVITFTPHPWHRSS